MDLGFTIMVEVDKDEQDLLELICFECNGAERNGGYIKLMSNVLKFEDNIDRDPNKINDEDGWLYYKFYLDGFPYRDSTEENQKLLVSKLCQCLSKVNALTELISEFEE